MLRTRWFILLFLVLLWMPACSAWEDETVSSYTIVEEINFYATPPLWVDVTGGPFEVGSRIVLNIFYVAEQLMPNARLYVELPPELAFTKTFHPWEGTLHAGERKLFRVPLSILSLPLSDVVRVTIASGETSLTVEWPQILSP